MTIDPTASVYNSEFAGLTNLKITPFSWSMPAQTLGPSVLYNSPTQSFPLPSKAQLEFIRMQLSGIETVSRDLSTGVYIMYFDSSNNWSPGNPKNYYMYFITNRVGNTLQQYIQIKVNSVSTAVLPTITVNLNVYALEAPF